MRSPVLALWALLPLLAAAQKDQEGPTPLSFAPAGDLGISAQMMFLGNKNKVYILDKTENNPATIDGKYGSHPAWAAEYDIHTQKVRLMDVYSNTFCAGGAVLGNGTWAVFGGNQPVTTGGVATDQPAAYKDTTGGTAIRLLDPCYDESCNYIQGEQTFDIKADTGGYLQMTGKRWYPTVETLEDGTLIVIGGDKNGGYVNTPIQDNPTYEFFPMTDEGAINLQFLTDTLPVNLYPLTWLMPSGKLFMQAARKTIMYDYKTKTATDLPDMPISTRVYPASAATAMLPLIPDAEGKYNPTLLFCGGSSTNQWGDDIGPGYNVTSFATDNSCFRISPDDPNPQYVEDDWMMEGRSMGQFVHLPDGTMWHGNGVAMGTAGYGDQMYSVGESYGQDPIYMPTIYNSEAPAGQRWNRTGLSASPNERMYHSVAILLPDSSVLISGSNPNKDFTTDQWRSRTDVERWYPWFYNEARPTYDGLPEAISYGGTGFDLKLNTTDEASANNTKVVLIRGGFNTHALGFGQRYIQLPSTYTLDLVNNSTTIHVGQLPGEGGPGLFQPGPAMFFVVINGVPSDGEFVMVGSGQLGTQPIGETVALPPTEIIRPPEPETPAVDNSTTPTGNNAAVTNPGSSANRLSYGLPAVLASVLLAPLFV